MSRFDEGAPLVLAFVMPIVHQLLEEGFIRDYAIGGSVAVSFYSEPIYTEDIDIFCYFSEDLASSLKPLYKRLEELGCEQRGMYAIIRGVKVQFQSMAHGDALEKEAVSTAIWRDCGENVQARVFQLEYAIAIKVQAGRAKDWGHIGVALESSEPDMEKLKEILTRYGLLSSWQKHCEH